MSLFSSEKSLSAYLSPISENFRARRLCTVLLQNGFSMQFCIKLEHVPSASCWSYVKLNSYFREILQPLR